MPKRKQKPRTAVQQQRDTLKRALARIIAKALRPHLTKPPE